MANVEAVEEDIEFEDMLVVAKYAYLKKMNVEDENLFYNELDKNPLSDEIKKKMGSEIEYAEDIDIEWDSEKEEELKKILPKLYKAFNE